MVEMKTVTVVDTVYSDGMGYTCFTDAFSAILRTTLWCKFIAGIV